jgi:hypothetical protein
VLVDVELKLLEDVWCQCDVKRGTLENIELSDGGKISEAVAECFPAFSAADHTYSLAAPDRIATVVSQPLGRRATVRALPGKRF